MGGGAAFPTSVKLPPSPDLLHMLAREPMGYVFLQASYPSFHAYHDPTQLPETGPSEYEKKKQTFITRSIWTFVMIGAFFGAMFMGHLYIIGIVTAVQVISFKEVIAIANVPSRARRLKFTKALNWYWLSTTMYFLYGESVIYYFKHIVLVDKVLLPFATHHRFISFMLYVIGEQMLKLGLGHDANIL